MSWAVSRIDEIAEVVTKGTTPTTYGMPFTDFGVNFIKAEALNGDSSLDNSGFAFVSESTHEKLKRSILAEGDILVTIAGAQVGRCGIVRAEYLPANTNQAVGIIRVFRERANPRFVYYFFKNPQTFRMCQGIGGQAAQPNINLTVLKRFDLPLPDLRTQDAIVEVLSAYDDLIENNRRRIALLEEAARLLYREWFVHFRFPGHEHIKIIDGLPDGWEAYRLGDLLTKIKRSGKVKKEDYLEEGLIPCVDQSQSFIGGYTEDEEAKITSPLPLVVFGDHTRALKFIDFPFACGADGTQLLYPKDDRLSIQYFYFAVGNIDLSNYFYARHFKFLKDQNLLVPTANLMAEFTDFSIDNLKQISTLREANHNLARARDLLLPRLMNGEIAV